MKTRTPLEFESIRLDRMPGFPPNPPFSVTDLEPGVNVITGPNMSGKTTLANAMSAVLWPSLADRKAEVTAALRHADAKWTLSVEGRTRLSCQRDGQTSEPPDLPPAEVHGRYHITLVELLQTESGSDRLAAQIATETAGGYDLSKAASEVGASTDVPGHRKEGATLEQARQKVRDQRQRQQELTRQEATLAALEEGRAQAELARAEVPQIEAAQELRQVTQEEAEAEAELAAFPDVMVHLTGSEEGGLQALATKLISERDKLGRCCLQRDAAADDLASIGLPEEGLPGDLLLSMRNRLQDLGALEDHLAQRTEVRAKASARARDALAALGTTPGQDAPRLDRAALAELETFAEKAERLAGRSQALKSQHSLLNAGTGKTDDDVGRLTRGRDHLVGWLKTPVDGAAGRPAPRGPIMALAALTALASLVLVVLVHWGFLALLVAGIVASVVALHGGPRPASASRDHFEREFIATGVGAPAAWTTEAVGQLLVELEEREAVGRLQQERQVELRRVSADLEDADRELGALFEERDALLARHGAAPAAKRDSGDAAFFVFARMALEWHLARLAAEEEEVAVNEVTGRLGALWKELSEALTPFGYEPERRAADIQAAVDDLADRRAKLEQARTEWRAAESGCHEHQDRISDLEGEIAAIFTSLGLLDGDEAGLHDLLRQLEPYVACRTRRQNAEVRRVGAAARLTQRGGEEVLAGLRDEELARRLEDVRAREESWEQTVVQITRIRTEIADAGGGTTLTDALAAEEEAREALRRCLDRDLDNVAAGLLVDHLKDQVRSRSRPPVFQRAAELLAEITAGTCKLDMEDSEPARFTVVETGDPRTRELDELSAGTRLQLLLAVRLAYIEFQEQGAALPLLLDETLANSDEERTLAIVEAMSAMAARGRQVFYFTAQHDEVAKWKAMSAQLGLVLPNVVDLAKVRKLERAREILLLDAVELPPAPPTPIEGESYLEYGRRLDVAGLDPRVENVDGVHVWHLLDDPRTVHALLVRRAPTWGRLCVLDEAAGGDDGLVTRPHLRRMRAAALAIEIAAEQWRVGRGRPVTRSVLRASNAVSDGFMDAMSAQTQACGGDAATLLAALRDRAVSRFREDKVNQLEEYLEQEGFLDTRPPVPEADALPRVMGALAKYLEAGEITEDIVAGLVASVYGFQEGSGG